MIIRVTLSPKNCQGRYCYRQPQLTAIVYILELEKKVSQIKSPFSIQHLQVRATRSVSFRFQATKISQERKWLINWWNYPLPNLHSNHPHVFTTRLYTLDWILLMFSSLYQHCFQEWDTHYQTDPWGNALKAVFPALLRSSLPLHSLSPILFRLCTGHCQLNHHLSRFGFHPDGLCARCEIPKTMGHIIEVCPKYMTARNRLRLALNKLGIPFRTPEILRYTAAAKLDETFVRESGVRL